VNAVPTIVPPPARPVTTAALRAALTPLGLLALGCREATEPEPPAGASLVVTAFYDAGGTSGVSGTWGTWCNWRTLDSTMRILSLTAQATPRVSADSARPALAFVSFAFRGRLFDEVPDDHTQRIGVGTADSVYASAGTVSVPYHADSETTRLRRGPVPGPVRPFVRKGRP
jgi:hypothetical protein